MLLRLRAVAWVKTVYTEGNMTLHVHELESLCIVSGSVE